MLEILLNSEMQGSVLEDSPELREFSKLVILQDRSIQSVLCHENTDCEGLYIVQKGTLSGFI